MPSHSMAVPATMLTAPSDRVKMVDMHPKEPLFLCSLYSGVINLWNFETQVLLKSFDTGTNLPVRCVRFIPRLQSFACGADDMQIRVFNYNTMEKTKTFQAHDDYIRGIAVHEHLPILLTCADDMVIRQWDWSKNWSLVNTHEGHLHYVMWIVFNPKDPATFATASLDCTIKVWSINSPVPNFQLEGHEDGVNCVDYYPGGDKPYLLSGADDHTVRLWDYQTKACLQVFSLHQANVTCVLFHPTVPLFFTLAEDMEMKIVASDTHRLLLTVDHSRMNRGWSMAARRHTNALVVGYDAGAIVYKIGDDKPIYSMDSNGKILVAVGNEVTRMDVKGIPDDVEDGDILSLPTKDMGALETSPSMILHAPSGQFITVIGENDYTILSSLSMRPKSYGKCISFIWGPDNGSYAVLESPMTLKIYKGFKERETVNLTYSGNKLFAGPLFGVCSAMSITFYDWATLSAIRQIDECPKTVQWNESGELLAIVTETAFFTLRFNSDEVVEYLEAHERAPVEGLDFAFEVAEEVEESVKEVLWVGDSLVFVNQAHRLNYHIGGETNNIAVLSRNQYFLGYLPKENRLFCIDKEKNITSYRLHVSVIEYMAAIVREDFTAASALLPSIDKSERPRLARFIQAKGHLELALDVTPEDDHRFDLAVLLGRIHLASEIAGRSPSTGRWKQVADLALEKGLFDLAEDACRRCGDDSGLLLLYSCRGDLAAVSALGDKCLASGKANIAFTCFHLAGRHAENVDLLGLTGKVGEAAFYARTYCPAKVEDAVAKWKVAVAALPRVREAIASPAAYPNLFPTMRAAVPTPAAPTTVPTPAAPITAPTTTTTPAAPSATTVGAVDIPAVATETPLRAHDAIYGESPKLLEPLFTAKGPQKEEVKPEQLENPDKDMEWGAREEEEAQQEKEVPGGPLDYTPLRKLPAAPPPSMARDTESPLAARDAVNIDDEWA